MWSDYDTQPQVEVTMESDLTQTITTGRGTGLLTGPASSPAPACPCALPRSDGTLIDVYQAATQMTDESGQTYPYTINTLLDNAIGTTGYYGAFTANMHTRRSLLQASLRQSSRCPGHEMSP